MAWELSSVLDELRKHGLKSLVDDYFMSPERWTAGLACGEAVPTGYMSNPWFFELPTNSASSMERVWGLPAEQTKLYDQHKATVRHAWPLDLFKLVLQHIKAETEEDRVSLFAGDAKIFVVGSLYWPPSDSETLDEGAHILCVDTRTEMINLEPAADHATWAKVPGRKDYLLLVASNPQASA